MTREQLYFRGLHRIAKFCEVNELSLPAIKRSSPDVWRFDSACAYYRPVYIAICVERCAHPSYGGRTWSWPGYVLDRAPFGVLAHELGHHVDYHRGQRQQSYSSEFGSQLRATSGEVPLTTYCPNDAEWFAEVFRLFVTNAALLKRLRPRAHAALEAAGLASVSDPDWPCRARTDPARPLPGRDRGQGKDGPA